MVGSICIVPLLAAVRVLIPLPLPLPPFLFPVHPAEDLPSAMSSYPDLLSTLSSTLLNSSSSPISRLAAMRALGSGVIEGIARHFSANPESQYHADFQAQVQSACLSTLTSALSDDHFLVRREGERAAVERIGAPLCSHCSYS